MCVVEVTEGRRGAKHARPHTKAAWPSRGSLRGTFGLRNCEMVPLRVYLIAKSLAGLRAVPSHIKQKINLLDMRLYS